MFQELYDSAWHHPGIAWIAGVPLLLFFVLRALRAPDPHRRTLAIVFVVLELEILADALFTGGLSPIDPKGTTSLVLAIAFVVLGDLRYFLFVERSGAEAPRPLPQALGRAFVLALIVPVAQRIAAAAVPLLGAPIRHVFLSYELMFAALAIVVAAVVLPRRKGPAATKRWLLWLTTFEIAQYLLWSTADVVILAGVDAGYLLRLVPNTMYYAAFVPFAWLTAPAEARP
jgi:hypothetical protein